mmetsp:Transcript_17761/g.49998  ORF Transcript_17761/g.49998 Transcript_17761/m.49998 type:complete len:271 (-) Transcript_17761:1064-1876(-)
MPLTAAAVALRASARTAPLMSCPPLLCFFTLSCSSVRSEARLRVDCWSFRLWPRMSLVACCMDLRSLSNFRATSSRAPLVAAAASAAPRHSSASAASRSAWLDRAASSSSTRALSCFSLKRISTSSRGSRDAFLYVSMRSCSSRSLAAHCCSRAFHSSSCAAAAAAAASPPPAAPAGTSPSISPPSPVVTLRLRFLINTVCDTVSFFRSCRIPSLDGCILRSSSLKAMASRSLRTMASSEFLSACAFENSSACLANISSNSRSWFSRRCT